MLWILSVWLCCLWLPSTYVKDCSTNFNLCAIHFLFHSHQAGCSLAKFILYSYNFFIISFISSSNHPFSILDPYEALWILFFIIYMVLQGVVEFPVLPRNHCMLPSQSAKVNPNLKDGFRCVLPNNVTNTKLNYFSMQSEFRVQLQAFMACNRLFLSFSLPYCLAVRCCWNDSKHYAWLKRHLRSLSVKRWKKRIYEEKAFSTQRDWPMIQM